MARRTLPLSCRRSHLIDCMTVALARESAVTNPRLAELVDAYDAEAERAPGWLERLFGGQR